MECSRDGDRQRENSREAESEMGPENRPGAEAVWQNRVEPQRHEPNGMGREREGSEEEDWDKAEVGGCHFTLLSSHREDARVCIHVCEHAAGWWSGPILHPIRTPPSGLFPGPGPYLLRRVRALWAG